MANLTPEEEKELAQLEAEFGTEPGKLTPEEEQELASLEAEFGTEPIQGAGLPGPEPEGRPLTAAAAGAVQGATFGWADEVAAGVKAAWDTALDTVSPSAKEKPGFQKNYQKQLTEIRDYLSKLEKENPKASVAGNIGGTVASLLVPGGMAAKGLGALVKGGKAAKAAQAAVASGAAGGAVAGAGYSEAETLADTVKDAGLGALVGMIPGGTAKVVAPIFRNIKKMAGRAELGGLGLTTQAINKLAPEKQAKLAQYARKVGILTSDKAKTAENAKAVKQAAGEAIDSFIQTLPDAKNAQFIDKTAFIGQLKNQILPAYNKGDTPAAKKLVTGFLQAVESIDPKDFKSVQAARQEIFGRHYSADLKGPTRQALDRVYGLYSESLGKGLDDLAAKIGDKNLSSTFKNLSQDYHLASTLADVAQKAGQKAEGGLLSELKKPMNIAQATGLGAGAYYGSPELASAALASRLVAKKFGPTLASKAMGIIEKGGPVADQLVKLAKDNKIDQMAAVLLGKTTAEVGNDNRDARERAKKSRETRQLLKQLRMPE